MSAVFQKFTLPHRDKNVYFDYIITKIAFSMYSKTAHYIILFHTVFVYLVVHCVQIMTTFFLLINYKIVFVLILTNNLTRHVRLTPNKKKTMNK